MDTLMQSQIFFFISSIGFIILAVLIAIFLLYLIRTTNTLSKILDKVERDINEIGDTTKEMVEDMRDSVVFNFLFGKKRRRRKD